jgi:hypothetical protein
MDVPYCQAFDCFDLRGASVSVAVSPHLHQAAGSWTILMSSANHIDQRPVGPPQVEEKRCRAVWYQYFLPLAMDVWGRPQNIRRTSRPPPTPDIAARAADRGPGNPTRLSERHIFQFGALGAAGLLPQPTVKAPKRNGGSNPLFAMTSQTSQRQRTTSSKAFSS